MNYLLETLVKVRHLDEIYVYCSDPAVQTYLPQGVKFLQRPASLDKDTTLGKEIYSEFVKSVDADIYMLAHTTSPFIKASTIETALDKVISGENDSAFSAEKIQTFAWYGGEPLNYKLEAVPRTQDISPVYIETSAFYIFQKQMWVNQGRRIGDNPYMAIVDKVEGVDIDWPEDFAFAEQIVSARQN